MSTVQLQTFVDNAHQTPSRPEMMVTRTLAEILPALAQAHEQGMAWLQDFADEPVQISTDLDEVIASFRDFCMA
ncbi:MAG: hypothetical protein MPJ50_04405 [Pirellulales bacterium]|nr:hypothetical protein [Pirellulales bacterium]